MTMLTLAIAATGMSAQEQNLEVIANNIANINTTGFKRSRAEFTDLLRRAHQLQREASTAFLIGGGPALLGIRSEGY